MSALSGKKLLHLQKKKKAFQRFFRKIEKKKKFFLSKILRWGVRWALAVESVSLSLHHVFPHVLHGLVAESESRCLAFEFVQGNRTRQVAVQFCRHGRGSKLLAGFDADAFDEPRVVLQSVFLVVAEKLGIINC